MSRRARARAFTDKRAITYFDGDAPDIEAAFARLTAERPKQETEDQTLHLKDGSAMDKREPWHLPDHHPQRGQVPR